MSVSELSDELIQALIANNRWTSVLAVYPNQPVEL